MDSNEIAQHISSQFNNELIDIRNQVLAMGRLVEQQISLAVQAFVNSDIKLAERVIKQEKQVDDYEVGIDEKCVQVHALRQPTAIDLRLLIAVIKTISELERIGDLADNIAKAAIHLADIENRRSSHREIQHFYDLVKDMLQRALDAFERMDTEGVPAIAGRHYNAEREYVSIVRQLAAQMVEDPRKIGRTLHVLTAVRAMESIGERIVNICHHAIYMVNGKDVRHLSPEEMERRMRERERSPQRVPNASHHRLLLNRAHGSAN